MKIAGTGAGRKHIGPVCLFSLALTACGTHEITPSNETLRTETMRIDWNKQQTLTASAGLEFDQFGAAVALHGDLALVGVPADEDDGEDASHDSGSAHVFRRTDGQWHDLRRLTASEPRAGAQLGISTAVTEGVAVAGAPYAQVPSDGGEPDLLEAGLVYVFRADGDDWSAPPTVVAAPDPAEYRHFGVSVAIDGDTLIVGAMGKDTVAGAAYAFVWSGNEWALEQELVPEVGARPGDSFGNRVALDGDTALIGAPDIDDNPGAAYVFARSRGKWSQDAALVGDDTAPGDRFGCAVALSGDLAAVNALYHDGDSLADVGAAYAFRRSTSGWQQDAKLLSPEPDPYAKFGWSVALDDQTLLVGAPEQGYFGAAFPFVRQATGWTAREVQVPDEDMYSPNFGVDVAVSGSSTLVGARYGDDFKGSAYVFASNQGSPCASDDDCVTAHCVQGLCCDTICENRCDSCLAADKESGPDGTCAPVAEGTNPRKSACGPEPVEPCGRTGVCDGQGECALRASGTRCEEASCYDEVTEDPADYCDGKGSCEPSARRGCEGYTCTEDACQIPCESDAECDAEHLCDDSRRCVFKSGIGVGCAEARECLSGYCTDGVCCKKSCGGQCEACAEPESIGSCVAITDEPRGKRTACPEAPSDEPCAVAECDGRVRDSCEKYAGTAVICRAASCDDGVAELEARCDGRGACATTPPQPCGAFRCAGTACKAICATNDDCAPESYCEAGECRTGAHCTGDGLDLVEADGSVTDCDPYKCGGTSCLPECSDSYDCADPNAYACRPATRECERIESEVTTSSGCGCRFGGKGTNGVSLLLLALWLGLRRRRGRTSTPSISGTQRSIHHETH